MAHAAQTNSGGIQDKSERREILFIISVEQEEEEKFGSNLNMQEIKNFIVTLTNRFEDSPKKRLFQAAVSGDTASAERVILEDNVAIDTVDDNNWNALTYAVYQKEASF